MVRDKTIMKKREELHILPNMQIDELILAFTHFVIWKWQNVKRRCAVISDIMKKPNAEKGKQQRGDSLVQKRQISIDLKSWKGQARGKPGAKKQISID